MADFDFRCFMFVKFMFFDGNKIDFHNKFVDLYAVKQTKGYNFY